MEFFRNLALWNSYMQSIRRSLIFRAPLALALVPKKTSGARAPARNLQYGVALALLPKTSAALLSARKSWDF